MLVNAANGFSQRGASISLIFCAAGPSATIVMAFNLLWRLITLKTSKPQQLIPVLAIDNQAVVAIDRFLYLIVKVAGGKFIGNGALLCLEEQNIVINH